jgi:adenosylcobinamide-GDP ribazoletransferase
MMRRFLAAVQFLTLLPVQSSDVPAAGVMFFPLVGAALGLAAGGLRTLAAMLFPAPLAALLALGFLIQATGALHEDGLADVFDAFRAGRSPERIQAILKDSRIGVYGAAALAMTLLLRWQAIELLDNRALPALAAACGASRGAMVVLAWWTPAIGDGLGKAFRLGLHAPAVLLTALESAALLFLCGPAAGAAALAVNALAVTVARAYFLRRAGGVTGDCLGAVCQISEVSSLLVFLCQPSI